MPGRARVEQRRRLVEHERVRVEQHEPRERDLLRLRRRERCTRPSRPRCPARSGSACTQPSASTARSARISSASSASTLASRRLSASDPDEHVVLLGHERDVPAQVLQRQVDQRHAADRHRAAGGRVDAGEHAAEGRLARAGRPDDGQPLPHRAGRGRCRAARLCPRGRRSGRRARRPPRRPGVAVARRAVRLGTSRTPMMRDERRRRHLDLVEPEDELPDRTRAAGRCTARSW